MTGDVLCLLPWLQTLLTQRENVVFMVKLRGELDPFLRAAAKYIIFLGGIKYFHKYQSTHWHLQLIV